MCEMLVIEKLPEPEKITTEIEAQCTCDKYKWSDCICPYQAEVWNDHGLNCNCCPYCEDQCLGNI